MEKMIRRVFALLLPLALLCSVGAQAVVGVEFEQSPDAMHIMETNGAPLLSKTRVYEGQFADVSADLWYYGYAVSGYEYGLFSGRETGFAADAPITVSELLTLSARLRAAYEGETIPASEAGGKWYEPYVAYLRGKGLLDEALVPLCESAATRAQLAGVFAASLPESCYSAPNSDLVTRAYASRTYITDVDDYTPYQQQILWLYRQGLLTGMDESGSYWPERGTTRAETAAVVTRMVDPSLRITLQWKVLGYRSAAGTTLASLIEAPASIPTRAPDAADAAAVDALCREMLAADSDTIRLQYDRMITRNDASRLVDAFSLSIKSYCEQMYNTVLCEGDSSGTVLLTFSAAGQDASSVTRGMLSPAVIRQYREQTVQRAIEVHDALWESGQLNSQMSEYEIARVYFAWLCDNCTYDYTTERAGSQGSLSHIAYSALVLGSAVCDGYTGAYNLFLKLEGIDCTAKPNDTHIWTVATLDGTEYHIDSTWGDQGNRIDWSYFAMTEAQSFAVHRW